jgi:hypothetical protein
MAFVAGTLQKSPSAILHLFPNPIVDLEFSKSSSWRCRRMASSSIGEMSSMPCFWEPPDGLCSVPFLQMPSTQLMTAFVFVSHSLQLCMFSLLSFASKSVVSSVFAFCGSNFDCIQQNAIRS